jgi:DNA-binding response OmpR family regulator
VTVVSHGPAPGLAPEVAAALWPAEGRCTVSGSRVALSRRELVAAAGHTLSRDRLYELVWGWPMRHRGRDVDVHVHKLRMKLDEVAPGWVFIHTHFGFAYPLAPEPRS